MASAESRTLKKGDKGKDVKKLQKRLNELGFWCGSADSSFGPQVQQAVWAFQKGAKLEKDGRVGPATRKALEKGTRPKPKATSGTVIEVDKKKQLVYCVSKGKLKYVFNTSTGSGERYYSGGTWKTAKTPTGSFTMFRFISGWETAPLGRMYRSAYFYKGYAIHGSTNIPTYPASHGCIRLSTVTQDKLFTEGWMKKGRKVRIY
jgi:peptidoglycan hydrolase-like protein with peptidoglycan-binding domain